MWASEFKHSKWSTLMIIWELPIINGKWYPCNTCIVQELIYMTCLHNKVAIVAKMLVKSLFNLSSKSQDIAYRSISHLATRNRWVLSKLILHVSYSTQLWFCLWSLCQYLGPWCTESLVTVVLRSQTHFSCGLRAKNMLKRVWYAHC